MQIFPKKKLKKRKPNIFQKVLSKEIIGTKVTCCQGFKFIFVNSSFKGWPDKPQRYPSVMDKEIETNYLHTEKDVPERGNEKTIQKLGNRNDNSDGSDTMASHRLEWCVQCQEYKEVMISWRRPDQAWVKINANAAIHNMNAGGGGLIRGHQGEWIQDFAGKLGRVLSFEAELWRVHNGLNLARQHCSTNVIVETDNFSIARLLSAQRLCDKKVLQPLSKIKDLLSRPWNVKIVYVYRESNKVADWLARYSMNQACFLDIHDLPLPGVKPFSLADATRVTTCHKIVADQEKWLEMDDAEGQAHYLMDSEKWGRCVRCQPEKDKL